MLLLWTFDIPSLAPNAAVEPNPQLITRVLFLVLRNVIPIVIHLIKCQAGSYLQIQQQPVIKPQQSLRLHQTQVKYVRLEAHTTPWQPPLSHLRFQSPQLDFPGLRQWHNCSRRQQLFLRAGRHDMTQVFDAWGEVRGGRNSGEASNCKEEGN